MVDSFDIKRAIECYSSGMFDEAYEVAIKLSKDDPGNIDILLLIAAIHAAKNDFPKVIEVCDKILDIEPVNKKACINAAVASQMLMKHAEAVSYASKLLATDPEDVNAVIIYTSSMRCLGNISGLITYLDGLSESLLKNPSVSIQVAKAYYDAFDYEGAATYFLVSAKHDAYAAESYHYLGEIYDKKGDVNSAIDAYMRALSIKPKSVSTLYNIALLYVRQGDYVRSFGYIVRCINDGGSKEARQVFTRILSFVGVDYIDADVLRIVTDILNDDHVQCQQLSHVLKEYVLKESLLLRRLYEAISSNNLDVIGSIDVKLLTEEMRDNKLLLLLLSNVLITDYSFESLIEVLRIKILEMLVKDEAGEELVDLCSCVSLQCELSGYIYSTTAIEDTYLRDLLSVAASQGSGNKILNMAVLSMYVPLYELKYKHDMEVFSSSKSVYFDRLLSVQLDDKEIEHALCTDISDEVDINDETSLDVARQYEESPYPVWRKLNFRSPKKICVELSSILDRGDCDASGLNYDIPDTLIAGCGTGKHAIQHSYRFNVNRIIAIDLSKKSLAYARRKSDELSVKNIEFRKMDILDVSLLDKKFDVIETVGVLHHMKDPDKGLRELMSCLKPGGLINIGLYSLKGRRHILKAKSIYHNDKKYLSDEEIKSRRKKIMGSGDTDMIENLTGIYEFFSLHECRDMIFHVQEHDYDLEMVKDMLTKVDLEFLGFEFVDPVIPARYAKEYPDDLLMRNLNNWEAYEDKYPDTFAGMYVFWCKKRNDS